MASTTAAASLGEPLCVVCFGDSNTWGSNGDADKGCFPPSDLAQCECELLPEGAEPAIACFPTTSPSFPFSLSSNNSHGTSHSLCFPLDNGARARARSVLWRGS